jgi:Gpi18-like mannosyltransferase
MYIIKLLSVGGTAFAALGMADLLRTCGGKPKHALMLFAVPSAIINAALLGQCDAIWAGSCLLAVSAMIAGRTVRSLVWCGIGFAFKAQAVFIAPFIVGAMIGRRAPLWQWAIPPLVFVAAMVPAWLAGWPAWQLAMIYPTQAQWFDIPGRLANPWIFATVLAPEEAKHAYWIGFAAVAVASVAIAALTSTSARNPRAMVLLALLSSLALPFLFPKMLERYFFLADLLSIAVALSVRSRATIFVAASVQLASVLTLIGYMYFYAWPWPTLVGAGFATAALAGTVTLVRRSDARWPRLKFSPGFALRRLPSA